MRIDEAVRIRPPAAGRRRRWLVIAAGALVVASAIVLVAALPRPAAAPDGPAIVLAGPASDASAQCAPLDAFATQALAKAEVALRGTVTSTAGGVIEIRPETFYRGGPAGVVRVRADDGGGAALDGADLQDGERVLVAATGGQVATCGLSATASPALQQYYDAAFGS